MFRICVFKMGEEGFLVPTYGKIDFTSLKDATDRAEEILKATPAVLIIHIYEKNATFAAKVLKRDERDS